METKKVKDIKVKPLDNYFFDTNIWLFLFAGPASSQKQKHTLIY